jgi:predicted aldo/keto reductase-like oxidoreductase
MIKKFGFGLMRLPLICSKETAEVDSALVTKMFDYYLEQGFSYFDTAYIYHKGASEGAVRDVLVRRHRRDSFTVTDKLPVWKASSRADYQRLFDEQLERCGVDYFDYYFLHSLGAQGYRDTARQGGFEFLEELKAQGRIAHTGFSFHDSAELLDEILTTYPQVEYVQLQLNYLDWSNESIQSGACYEVATRHNKPVIVMEPVKGGALATLPPEAERLLRAYDPQASAASWAIRFAASLDNVCVVLSGMNTLEQVIDNTGFMRDFTPLNSEERALVAQVVELINSAIAVPCTACSYCTDDCPQNIPIPACFALYNNRRQFGFSPILYQYYTNVTQGRGKASSCIGCGQCDARCPQHIKVSERLAEVAETFEQKPA